MMDKNERRRKLEEYYNGSSYIPHALIFDKGLRCIDKTLYMTIVSTNNHPFYLDGYCYLKQSSLAELLNTSIRTIQRSLKVLQQAGYIEVKRRIGESNICYIIEQPFITLEKIMGGEK